MTDEELTRYELLASCASPGEWYVDQNSPDYIRLRIPDRRQGDPAILQFNFDKPGAIVTDWHIKQQSEHLWHLQMRSDGLFLAEARKIVLALCAEVRALRAENKAEIGTGRATDAAV
jgi:hypothetical protein